MIEHHFQLAVRRGLKEEDSFVFLGVKGIGEGGVGDDAPSLFVPLKGPRIRSSGS
jgi:hypothetical protein